MSISFSLTLLLAATQQAVLLIIIFPFGILSYLVKSHNADNKAFICAHQGIVYRISDVKSLGGDVIYQQSIRRPSESLFKASIMQRITENSIFGHRKVSHIWSDRNSSDVPEIQSISRIAGTTEIKNISNAYVAQTRYLKLPQDVAIH